MKIHGSPINHGIGVDVFKVYKSSAIRSNASATVVGAAVAHYAPVAAVQDTPDASLGPVGPVGPWGPTIANVVVVQEY